MPEEIELYSDPDTETEKELVEITNGSDQYLMLPSSYDIHQYKIMEAFCHEIGNEKLQETLLNSI